MGRGLHCKAKAGVAATVLSLTALAGWALWNGRTELPRWSAAFHGASQKPAYANLVPEEPSAAMESPMCEWVPASARAALLTATEQGNRSGAASSSSAESRTPGEIDRPPVRIIRDSYPSYSAVAVDTRSDEVFLQDENLFGVKVFNRLDNTPPQASFTEPKRVIGGNKTKIEFSCGLYIDPQNGDVYSLANDTVDTLVVFPHDAKGNIAPMRELATPQATFGLAVDEQHQELFLTDEMSHSVIVYRKMASGREPPLRELVGESTQLADPHGIAVDPQKDLLFVNNGGASYTWDSTGNPVAGTGKFSFPSITVYRLKASGNTSPLRVIQGPKTELNWPGGMYLDLEHKELYVANDGTDSILVFREDDSGDVAPVRILKGSKTSLKNPTGLTVDLKNDELWVANLGNHTATVYPRAANGDVTPRRTIRSAPRGQLSLMVENPGAVGYDTKREQILVAT